MAWAREIRRQTRKTSQKMWRNYNVHHKAGQAGNFRSWEKDFSIQGKPLTYSEGGADRRSLNGRRGDESEESVELRAWVLWWDWLARYYEAVRRFGVSGYC